jgi:hypothetical protein
MNEPLPDLVATFRVRRGLFRRETVEAGLFELDDYGCVLKTDKVFEPGDSLVFDLVMDMPFDDIRAEGLKGLVTERRKHCSNFFYSIDFKSDGVSQDSPIADKLRRIREVLDKKQSLRSRRGSGGPLSGMREMA